MNVLNCLQQLAYSQQRNKWRQFVPLFLRKLKSSMKFSLLFNSQLRWCNTYSSAEWGSCSWICKPVNTHSSVKSIEESAVVVIRLLHLTFNLDYRTVPLTLSCRSVPLTLSCRSVGGLDEESCRHTESAWAFLPWGRCHTAPLGVPKRSRRLPWPWM